ncbi:MAG: MBL fold metallo-hydrolase [Oscillospiraceae bacterium]
MKIDILTVGPIGTNCYIVSDANKKCAVIDPGDEADRIVDFLDDKGLTCEYILLTHGHFDHIGALEQVKRATGASLVMNAADRGRIKLSPEILCADGDEIAVGDNLFSVIATPGHTEGGVCYKCGDSLFSGDTLFCDSVGRTDLPGGDFETLRRSLLKLRDLPDADLKVYPGHMESTTLAHEREFNPFIEKRV